MRENPFTFTEKPKASPKTVVKQGVPGWAVLAIVLMVAVVLGGGSLIVAYKIIWARKAQPAPVVVKAKEIKQRPTMTRNEFRSLVMGKTMEEVVRAVGRPDRTGDENDLLVLYNWSYERRTVDPLSGRTDHVCHLYFDENGRVNRVAF